MTSLRRGLRPRKLLPARQDAAPPEAAHHLKFEAMDYLWTSLSADADGIPPAWHERELARTASRVEAGIEHPIPWPAARDILEGFRNLAGCWASDSGVDDVEAILRRARASRPGNRPVPDFGV